MELDRRLAVRMVADGMSYSEVAAHYGVTRNVIAGLCHRAGLRTGRADNRPGMNFLRPVAIALVREGKSFTATAKIVGVSNVTVLKWCRKVGVSSRFHRRGIRKQSRPARGGAGRLGSMGQSP